MTDEALATAAVDADGVVTAWSAQAEGLLGYPASEVLGRPLTGLLAGDLPGKARTPDEEFQPWAGQVAVRHRDGRRMELWIRAHPVQDAAGRPQWFLVGFPASSVPAADPEHAPGSGDIRVMLDWAVTQSPVGVALVDTEMRQLRLNAAMCRIFGLETAAAGSSPSSPKAGAAATPGPARPSGPSSRCHGSRSQLTGPRHGRGSG